MNNGNSACITSIFAIEIFVEKKTESVIGLGCNFSLCKIKLGSLQLTKIIITTLSLKFLNI